MQRTVFVFLILVGIAIRFFHFGEQLDSPHTWRQADTANYIYDFYQNGIDLFHPSVCWMGDYKTVALEFPLPEAIVAAGYQVFGESHIVARFIFLLFFIGALRYFYLFIRFLFTIQLAQIATLIFLFAPLSLFYSRAVHIDFAALFFALGMAYHYMKGYRDRVWKHVLIGSIFATLAMLTKVPYVLPFTLPVIWIIFKSNSWKYVAQTIYLPIVPVTAFYGWQRWTFSVNNNAPDWDFLVGHRKMVNNSHWYFGSWAQRADTENWNLLTERIGNEILGWSGTILGAFGLIMAYLKKRWVVFILSLSTILYAFIFFNLNVIHNYYQIPFIVPASVLIAIGITEVNEFFDRKHLLGTALVILFAVESITYAEKHYYVVQHEQIEIGELVKQQSKPDDLIVMNYNNIDLKCPNYLYRARRNGWQVLTYDLKAAAIYQLMQEGADYFVTVRTNRFEGEIGIFLNVFEEQVFPLESSERSVYIYYLDPERVKPRD